MKCQDCSSENATAVVLKVQGRITCKYLCSMHASEWKAEVIKLNSQPVPKTETPTKTPECEVFS